MIFQYLRILVKSPLEKRDLKNIAITALGSILEFYDLIIFSFVSVYMIKIMFHDQRISHRKVFYLFSIFIIGYFARPLGMIIYNSLALRLKIRTIQTINAMLLISTNLILAFASNQYFIWFPLTIILIILARITQGVSGGIEMQASFHYLRTRLNVGKINLAVFGVLAGYEVGQLLAITINRVLHISFNLAQLANFGWRISFIFGSVLTLGIYFIRLRYAEIIQIEDAKKSSLVPAYQIFRYYPQQTIIACILSGVKGCSTFIYLVVIPFNLYQVLKLSPKLISHYIMLSNIISIIIAFLINKIITEKNLTIITTLCCLLLLPTTLLWTWSFTHNQFILLSIIPVAILPSIFTVLIPRLIINLFPPTARLYGVAFSYHSGFIIFAGIVPIITIGISFLMKDLVHVSSHPILTFGGSIFYSIIISIFSLYAILISKKYV